MGDAQRVGEAEVRHIDVGGVEIHYQPERPPDPHLFDLRADQLVEDFVHPATLPGTRGAVRLRECSGMSPGARMSLQWTCARAIGHPRLASVVLRARPAALGLPDGTWESGLGIE